MLHDDLYVVSLKFDVFPAMAIALGNLYHDDIDIDSVQFFFFSSHGYCIRKPVP